ncbi:hypothetical protein LI328DRAFT_100061 [Trichoderma asperelloides]|nr:hypothetical protein LI328DRAFT_100061 [Trichoderma asperelloides]
MTLALFSVPPCLLTRIWWSKSNQSYYTLSSAPLGQHAYLHTILIAAMRGNIGSPESKFRGVTALTISNFGTGETSSDKM